MFNYEVIIPSYGRDHLLGDQLAQLRKLYPTLSVCWGLQGEYSPELHDVAAADGQVRIVHRLTPHITATINECVQSSQADFILLLDDDALPCPGWLEAFDEVFRQYPDLAYCMGREVRLGQPWSLVGAWLRLLSESFFVFFVPAKARIHGRIVGWMNALGFLWGNFDLSGTCVINSPRGCNLALHRRRTMELGGFDENFQGNQWGFETEFGLRLQQRGLLGRYCGTAAVLHTQTALGGTRTYRKWSGVKASWHNHELVNKHLGLWAWVGAIPRLLRASFVNFRSDKQ